MSACSCPNGDSFPPGDLALEKTAVNLRRDPSDRLLIRRERKFLFTQVIRILLTSFGALACLVGAIAEAIDRYGIEWEFDEGYADIGTG